MIIVFVLDVGSLIIMVNLNDYSEGQHTLEIVGLTQVPEILRTTVKFPGVLVIATITIYAMYIEDTILLFPQSLPQYTRDNLAVLAIIIYVMPQIDTGSTFGCSTRLHV